MPGAREQDSLTPEELAGLVKIGVYATTREAHQAGTAILAMGEWYVVLPEEEQWSLCVREAVGWEAARLLERQRREPPLRPPERMPEAVEMGRAVTWWAAFPYILIMATVFWWTGTGAGHHLVEAGRFDAERIRENGEWWRLLTPLFLHADAGHLWGNLFGGLFFGYFLARRIGVGWTYGAALLFGVLGNALNLLTFWSGSHLSIGASTAVFGLLGALPGLRLVDLQREQGERPVSALEKRRAAWQRGGVLAAGLVLLAWLGAGGERTDVLAHLYGFLAGFMVMLVAGRWLTRQTNYLSSDTKTLSHHDRIF